LIRPAQLNVLQSSPLRRVDRCVTRSCRASGGSCDRRVLDEAMSVATQLAVYPLASQVASKRLIAEAWMEFVQSPRSRENEAFDVLLASPESRAAVAAFVDRRVG
jgi:hypothetical protein